MRSSWISCLMIATNVILALNSGQNVWWNVFTIPIICNLVFLFTISSRFSSLITNLFWQTGQNRDILCRQENVAVRNSIIWTQIFIEVAKLGFSNFNKRGAQKLSDLVQTARNLKVHNPLLLCNNKIIELRIREKENNWISQDIASSGELKHKGNDIIEHSFQAISSIVKYLSTKSKSILLLKETNRGDGYFESEGLL